MPDLLGEGHYTKLSEDKAGDNKAKLKKLKEDIKLYKYVGETAHSLFKTSAEHITDFENLSIKRGTQR